MMLVNARRLTAASVATALLGLALVAGCSSDINPMTPSESITSTCLTVTRVQAKVLHLSPNSNHQVDWDVHNGTGSAVTINYSGSGSDNGTVTNVVASGGTNIPAGATGEALATFHIGASGTSGGVNVTVSTSCGAVTFPIYVIFAN
jgi:hypothetical protein